MLTVEDRIREIEERARHELPVEAAAYELIILAVCEAARQMARLASDLEAGDREEHQIQ